MSRAIDVPRLKAFLDGARLDYVGFDGRERVAWYDHSAQQLTIVEVGGAPFRCPVTESDAAIFWMTNVDRTAPARSAQRAPWRDLGNVEAMQAQRAAAQPAKATGDGSAVGGASGDLFGGNR